ncbi:MAG: hydrolase [Gammaproteobacteria bacterium]
MSTDRLDPRTTALVAIDLQHGIVAMPVAPHAARDVIARTAEIAARLRAAGGTVVLVRVANSADGRDALAPITDAPAAAAGKRPDNWSELVPELGQQPGDIVITKRQWGAFYGTELDLQLRRRGITTLVMTGIATHVGVESTARDAFERGYQQVFVEDAIASPSADAHANTFKFVFPRIGRIRKAADVAALLG